jgi:hypothetical protein
MLNIWEAFKKVKIRYCRESRKSTKLAYTALQLFTDRKICDENRIEQKRIIFIHLPKQWQIELKKRKLMNLRGEFKGEDERDLIQGLNVRELNVLITVTRYTLQDKGEKWKKENLKRLSFRSPFFFFF